MVSKNSYQPPLVRTKRSHLRIGKCGEDAAALYLKREGFKILNRNWSCETGEIDIIALKQGILSIVEVKTRSAEIAEGFSPFAAVDTKKSNKLKKITDRYLHLERGYLKRFNFESIRFDVAAVFYKEDLTTGNLSVLIKYLPDAFNY